MEFYLESPHCDLEKTLHTIAATLAAERGVEVKETRVELSAPSRRRLEFRITCQVKAMIVSATLVARGKAEINDELAVRVTELALEGEGMVASLAKSALEPQLAKVRGKEWPLASLRLPGLAVDDVELSAAEVVRLTVRLKPLS